MKNRVIIKNAVSSYLSTTLECKKMLLWWISHSADNFESQQIIIGTSGQQIITPLKESKEQIRIVKFGLKRRNNRRNPLSKPQSKRCCLSWKLTLLRFASQYLNSHFCVLIDFPCRSTCGLLGIYIFVTSHLFRYHFFYYHVIILMHVLYDALPRE